MRFGIYTDGLVYPQRFKYVLDFVNNHPVIPKDFEIFLSANLTAADIIYGNHRIDHHLHIHQSAYLFNEKLPNIFNCTIHRIGDKNYYAIGKGSEGSKLASNGIPFDLFETIFFCISRIEEKHLPFDQYLGKKEIYDDSFVAVKHNIEKIPVADHLVVLLYEMLTGKKLNIPTTISVTHDIDEIRKYTSWHSVPKKIGGQLLNRKNISKIPEILAQAYNARNRDPYDTSSWMMSDNPDLPKEIYFLCGGKHKWDTPINLKDRIFHNFVKCAQAKGYEIGIHPSYLSWNKPALIKKEKEILENALNQSITISRQHFLNFDVSITPYILAEMGIDKDGSLGFSRHIGFRSGTGFDHRLYDFDAERAMDILESPLVFMDVGALYETNYQIPAFIELQKEFLHSNAFNTHITFLYHNTIFDEIEMRGHSIKNEYLRIFDHA